MGHQPGKQKDPALWFTSSAYFKAVVTTLSDQSDCKLLGLWLSEGSQLCGPARLWSTLWIPRAWEKWSNGELRSWFPTALLSIYLHNESEVGRRQLHPLNVDFGFIKCYSVKNKYYCLQKSFKWLFSPQLFINDIKSLYQPIWCCSLVKHQPMIKDVMVIFQVRVHAQIASSISSVDVLEVANQWLSHHWCF